MRMERTGGTSRRCLDWITGHWLPRLVAVAMLACPAAADMVIFRGKVVMEDGSPPGRPVAIQRRCTGFAGPQREAGANPKSGEYYIRLYVEPFGSGFDADWRADGVLSCYLEAASPGFISTRLDLSNKNIRTNPQLPNLVLSRPAPGALDLEATPALPQAGRKQWETALKRVGAKDWDGAEAALRAVVAAAPDYAPAWTVLGSILQNLQKPAEARAALRRALQLAPKQLPLYQALVRVEVGLKDWPAAAHSSEALIQRDPGHIYLEAYLDSAVAFYQQKDYDHALKRIQELIQLDQRRAFPRAAYVLAVILEARGDLDGAAAELRKYLDESVNQDPQSGDAAAARERLANLGKQPPGDLSGEAASAGGFRPTAGEAPVPGGLKAFAIIARMTGRPAYEDFFLQYCRAIVGSGPEDSTPTREVADAIRAFIAAEPELEQLGERRGNRIVIRLSLAGDEQRKKTERVLELMGWRLRQSGQSYDVELGDQPVDGTRQRIPGAFGIDELEMRDALVAGRPFQFEIPIENARLVGGAAWSATLKRSAEPSRGPVDLFLSDWRVARAYSGLGAMEAEAAGAVASSVGLVPLITRYSDLVALYGESLRLAGNRVVVPGGANVGIVA